MVDRPLPTFPHSRVQVNLTDAFKEWQDRGELFRAIEIRLRIAENRFRIADFALFSSKLADPIPEQAPCAVIEIISPDDRFNDLMQKLADYEDAGVEFIHVADPPTWKLWRYRHGDLSSVPALELAAHQVSISLDSIFN